MNVVIETGGTKKWHAQATLGLDIATDRLQRYTYTADGYALVDEQPLASMADRDTLTEFIQWTAANYPAKKYMLVAWDHGGGSLSGLIVDELYNDSIMATDDFGRALRQSGISFETVLLDTCKMGSLEMAQTLQPSTKYLLASEESVPGNGTAFDAWLQLLYDHPEMDGRAFGEQFVPTYQAKYPDTGVITFSCLDLTQLDVLTEAFNAMFREIRTNLDDSLRYLQIRYSARNTELFDTKEMLDVYDFADCISEQLGETADQVKQAVEQVVIAETHGTGHADAHGISFYDALTCEFYTLDRYARVSPNAEYLAYIDQVRSDWSAPEWVYEATEHIRDVSAADYSVSIEGYITDDNQFFAAVSGNPTAALYVTRSLYYKMDDDTYASLGTNAAVNTVITEDGLYLLDSFDGTWPSLQGVPLELNLLNDGDQYALYYVPLTTAMNYAIKGYDAATVAQLEALDVSDPYNAFQMELLGLLDEQMDVNLRVAYVYDNMDVDASDPTMITTQLNGHWEILGIWNGSENDHGVANRNTIDLSNLYGATVAPTLHYAYVSDGAPAILNQIASFGEVLFSADSAIVDEELPIGEYLYQLTVEDVLGNKHSAYANLTWDGENAVFSQVTLMTTEEKRQLYYEIDEALTLNDMETLQALMLNLPGYAGSTENAERIAELRERITPEQQAAMSSLTAEQQTELNQLETVDEVLAYLDAILAEQATEEDETEEDDEAAMMELLSYLSDEQVEVLMGISEEDQLALSTMTAQEGIAFMDSLFEENGLPTLTESLK